MLCARCIVTLPLDKRDEVPGLSEGRRPWEDETDDTEQADRPSYSNQSHKQAAFINAIFPGYATTLLDRCLGAWHS